MQWWPAYDWDEAALPYRYLFRPNQDSTNVQANMNMNPESGTDYFPNLWYYWNWGGWSDGHGEIVGFRALIPNVFPPQSYPLALAAQNWPRGGACPIDKTDAECRVYHLKNWENDSDYLDSKDLAPQKPPKAYYPLVQRITF